MLQPDDLNRPLGLAPPASRQRQRGARFLVSGLVLAGIVGGGAVIVHIVASAPPAADRAHVAIVRQAPPPLKPLAALPGAADATGSIAPAGQRPNRSQVSFEHGVRVVRKNPAHSGALIIHIPQHVGMQLTPAPDPRLVENSRFGPLPKMADNGDRPAAIYARPLERTPGLPPGAPRIAIVLGGMGLNEATTRAAMAQLPGAVTFGFAPYGPNLQAQVNRARADGHEILLQLPMEPFDYAHNNPGPHTLLTSVGTAQRVNDLHWLMSRFTGYVGLETFLGAQFTARADVMEPLLQEASERGLDFADDGSSPQSLVSQLSLGVGLPARRADLVLDTDPDPNAIRARLQQLLALARENHTAFATASALPASIDALAGFCRSLKREGVELVPFSSVVIGGRVAQAGGP